MEFKKCERCGCFFTSPDMVCHNCIQKDKAEMNQLKNYFDINPNVEVTSLNAISIQTGISEKNLNRYMQDKNSDISSIVNNHLNIQL